MQKALQTRAGDLVRIRRQRWRVLDVHDDGIHRLITASGIGASNIGAVRPFITPFDLVERDARATHVRQLSRRQWRRAVRAAILEAAPPAALRAIVDADLALLPYQLEPALAILSGRGTRVLLADDVGLGKTIQAGLILAELRRAGAVSRTLIVVPAGLREQWQGELTARFGIAAALADTAALRRTVAAFAAGLNPWLTLETAITSIDLVKRPEHLAQILKVNWDLLIVDEAHAIAGESDRRQAATAIADRTPYVVLLTATPHSGSRSDFLALCATGGHGDRLLMFRRTRRDLQMSSRRRLHRLSVTPTAAERHMHAALATFTRAVRDEHDESSREVWLALAVLNKRALSSAWSLAQTISRRLESLERDTCGGWQPDLFTPAEDQLDDDVSRDWPAGASLSNPDRERRLLIATHAAAMRAAAEGESKIRALCRLLGRTAEPAIVFTEYRDTLHHLAACLNRPSVKLHGLLSASDRRDAIDAFTRDGGVLLATDAAAEGLNLHCNCRLVVHLELPWNPMRLEQRVGRVDRIGQRRTVHAIALVGRHTHEEEILQRLRERIARARNDAAAPDPLDGERAIERLVLDGAAPEFVAGEPFEPPIDRVELRDRAERERQRVNGLLAIASKQPSISETIGAGWCRARNRRTRSRLAGRALLILELQLEDGCGRIVYRDLCPVLAPTPLSSTSIADSPQGIAPAIETSDDVAIAWKVEALQTFHEFAMARATRERAIVSMLAKPNLTHPWQAGLFDRRAERTRTTAEAAEGRDRASAERRLALAEQALSMPSVHKRLRFVLLP